MGRVRGKGESCQHEEGRHRCAKCDKPGAPGECGPWYSNRKVEEGRP